MSNLVLLSSKSEKLINLDAETATGKLLNSPYFEPTPKAGWANYTKQSNETRSLFINYLDETSELLISENGGLGGAAEFRVFIKITDIGIQKSLITIRYKSGFLSASAVKWLSYLSLFASAISLHIHKPTGYVLLVITSILFILNLLNRQTIKKVKRIIHVTLEEKPTSS